MRLFVNRDSHLRHGALLEEKCARVCACPGPRGLCPYQYEPRVCYRARFAHISTVDKVVLFHINTNPEFVKEQGGFFAAWGRKIVISAPAGRNNGASGKEDEFPRETLKPCGQ